MRDWEREKKVKKLIKVIKVYIQAAKKLLKNSYIENVRIETFSI